MTLLLKGSVMQLCRPLNESAALWSQRDGTNHANPRAIIVA
jgi:hypothetical protein